MDIARKALTFVQRNNGMHTSTVHQYPRRTYERLLSRVLKTHTECMLSIEHLEARMTSKYILHCVSEVIYANDLSLPMVRNWVHAVATIELRTQIVPALWKLQPHSDARYNESRAIKSSGSWLI